MRTCVRAFSRWGALVCNTSKGLVSPNSSRRERSNGAGRSFHARAAGAVCGSRGTRRSGRGAPGRVGHGRGAGRTKKGDSVRVTDDQMHQLGIMKVELYPFRVQKLAIGQIAYNEDTSTAVLTPFPGRVTRLVAKVGDQVRRGDPLFEIDSPEVVQPQNDFIAAVTALNKARSQLDLAGIVEKRFKDLYEGKAAALKEWQQAQAQLARRRAICARPRSRSRRRGRGCALSVSPSPRSKRSSRRARSGGRRRSSRQSTAPSSPARSDPDNMSATIPPRRSIPSPISPPCG